MQPITHIHLDHLDSLPDDPLLLKELMRLQQEACIHERLKHEAILDELKKQFEFDLQQKLDEQRKIQEKEHQAHIFELYEKILADRRRQFGVKSEIDTHQLWLFNEEEVVLEEVPQEEVSEETSATPSKAPAAAKKPRGKRAPLPAELPRIDIIHDVPEDQRICPCGTLMVEIGEEVSESLEIIPMQARVQRHIRKRYGCPHGDHPPVIAPPPAQVLPKSNATPSLLAALLVVKYVDGLPLARFEYVLGRSGIWIPRQTMARWVIDAAGALQPLVNLLRDVLLDHDVIHMDETPIQVLKEPGRSATSKSQMWIMRGGPPDQPVILFEYDPSRSQAVPLRLLEGWSGYLMTDGLKSYGAIAFSEGVTRLSCMTHARRYFVEAAKVLPKGTSGKAHQALAFFHKLYAIERECRDMTPEERHAVRQARSQPVLDALKTWADEQRPTTPPQTLLGKALTYLNNQWSGLIRYLERGDLPIDNNPAENGLRPFVVGRKAWLFADTPAGAKASAIIYSLVETAKANGLEPYTWLRAVLEALHYAKTVEDYEALLPWRFKPKPPPDP